MKLSALIAFRIFLAFGFMAPLWDALSEGTPSPGPVPESSPGPDRTDALVQLQHEVESNGRNAPDIVAKAIQADPQHSIFYAGEVVRYALRGLGSSISEAEISFLIAAAVNARPQAALQIVRVAVGEVPPKFHANIVAAAVAEVPDPYEEVVVVHRREGSPEPPKSIEQSKSYIIDEAVVSDGKSAISDCKSVVAEGKAVAAEGKEPIGPEIIAFEPSTAPGSMTLAEAIVLAALQGGSTVGLDTLMDIVNIILLSLTAPLGSWVPTDLSTLITKSPPITPSQTPPPAPPPPTPPPISPQPARIAPHPPRRMRAMQTRLWQRNSLAAPENSAAFLERSVSYSFFPIHLF